jgi:hypothetical protein
VEINANRNCEVHHQGADLLANYHFNQGVDGGSNSGITLLVDSSSFGNNLLLDGFALQGTTSNFTANTPILNGAICTTFCLPAENPQQINIPNPCRNLSSTVSVSQGNLNNATNWYWYTSSCGGNPVDSGISIQFIPTSSITTLFVRGEGGCTIPGPCTTASFFAPDPPDVTFSTNFAASCDSINGSGSITILADPNNYDGVLSYRIERDSAFRGGVTINDGGFFGGLKGGTYFANVSSSSGCYDPFTNDTIVIRELPLNQCIVPDFNPPDSGYVPTPIGATLTQIIADSTILTDTTINPGLSFEVDDQNRVLIDVIAVDGQKAALLALLQTPAYGLVNIYPNGEDTLTITGFYPAANLALLNPLYPSLLRFAEVNRRPINNGEEQGIAISQGDQAMSSNTARGAFRVTGKNIKVGVISNSYNTLPGDPAGIDVSNYDLPGTGNPYNSNPVSVLEEYPYGPQSDEGRAMMQIVHDIAPDAKLAFKTGFITSGHFAESIIALANDSCDVIVDDVTYVTEPFFTDGIVAQAVDEVTARGVSYFSAAGNFGNASYEGNFNGTTAPPGFSGEAHDFAGGDVAQSVTLSPGAYTIVLQWEDSIYSLGQLSGASTDLDIYLLDKDGNLLFGFNRDNTGEDPIELLPFVVNGNIDANLLILRRSGNTPVRFKYIVFRGNIIINEHNQNTGTCVGQANAAGAMAVSSVLYSNTPYYGNYSPTVSSFSSRGGVLINGVDRQKPDFTAPNGVNTTVNLGGFNIDYDIFPNFFGTSAAAPHAAGLAALALEGKEKYDYEIMSPSSVRSLLRSGVYEMYNVGYDENSGTGLLNADSVLGKFASPVPNLYYLFNSSQPLQPGPQPINVNIGCTYCGENTKVIFQYDTITPTMIFPGYYQATVPAFSGNPPFYLYNAPISLSQQDGGNSDSSYFFFTPNQNVVVTVGNKTKKYGENLPAFSFSVTIDGTPLDTSLISLDSLGLNDITYTTPATANSNVGNYFIKASSGVTDLSNPKSLELSKSYTYSFVNGVLSIEKMPVAIKPIDTSILYGNKIGAFSYDFQYEDSAIDPAGRAAFLAALNAEYIKDIAPAVALVDSRVTVGSRSLTSADLENLSFLASTRSLTNGRNGGSATALVNGTTVPDPTLTVDVAVASVFNYQVNQDTATLEETLPLVNPRALVSTLAMLNGTALVNGRNGGSATALVNGRNGGSATALVNGSTVPSSGNFQPVAIVDEEDVNAPTGDSLFFKTIPLITGYVAGNHFIVPPAFMSPNFEPSYDLGNLTITPVALLITANDTTAGCGGNQPAYTSTIQRKYNINGTDVTVPGYCYSDNNDSVFVALPQYEIYDAGSNLMGSGALAAGSYSIRPAGAQLRQPPNYTVEYADGTLSVNDPLVLTANLSEPPCSGQTGFVGFSATGGTTPYTFTVNGVNAVSPFTLSTAGSYKVKVVDALGCADSTTLNFVFAANSTNPSSITASPSVVVPGGSTTLTVNGGSLGTGASWKWYSGSCGGTPVGTGTSITVNPTSTTTYFVRAEGLCNNSNCVSVTVTVALCGPTSISSSSPNNTICSGQSVYLYVRGTLLSSSSWRWYRTSCGNPGTPRSSIGSDSLIRVAPTTTTTYYVRSEGGACGITQCLSITIIVKTIPARPGTITGQTAGLCNASNITYTVAPMADATSYYWGIPGGATIVSGQGTNSIVVNFGSLLTNGTSTSSSTICVRGINECGTGTWSCLNISLRPAFNTQISGPNNLVAYTTGTYSIDPAFGATSYRWTTSSGWSIVSGQGTLSVVVRAGKSNGYVRVTPSNSCGTGTYANKNVTVTAAKPGRGEEIREIRVWPNPAISELIIDPGGLEPMKTELVDAQGRIVYRADWSVSLDVSSFAPGVYLLRLYTVEGVKTRKVVIASPR